MADQVTEEAPALTSTATTRQTELRSSPGSPRARERWFGVLRLSPSAVISAWRPEISTRPILKLPSSTRRPSMNRTCPRAPAWMFGSLTGLATKYGAAPIWDRTADAPSNTTVSTDGDLLQCLR